MEVIYSMPDVVEYTEVPKLQEVLEFLPIEPDEENINDYIRNITDLIDINYKFGQFQFAYFGLHLLYMTYIYCTAWKAGQIEPQRYRDAIIFARAYNGREKELKLEDADSVFAYSLIPETEIVKLFSIIDMDKSQFSSVSLLVKTRNNMAHASGKFEILTEDSFGAKMESILNSMKAIHRAMEQPIRKWYRKVLLGFCTGKYEGYSPRDIIFEEMLQSFKLSAKELIICNEMSVGRLITDHRDYKVKLKDFKRAVTEYCQELGYI